MITREALLDKMSQQISDELSVPNSPIITKASQVAFRVVALNVILPLLDVLEFDAKPVFREVTINQVRDLLTEPETPQLDR